MKKFLCILMTIVMVAGFLPPMAVRAEVLTTRPTDEWAKENGWEYTGSFWSKTVDNINYRLTYSVNKYGQQIEEGPSYQISTTRSPNVSGKVVIPAVLDGYPVKQVGRDTFNTVKTVTECIISEGVEIVAQDAFYWAMNLEKVSLPSTLKMIDAGAFGKCYKLEELTVPESVDYIGRTAFSGAGENQDGLRELYFEGNAPEILYISQYTTQHLAYLTNVTINVKEGTTGWDTERWTPLNINVVPKEDMVFVGIQLDDESIEMQVGESTSVKVKYLYDFAKLMETSSDNVTLGITEEVTLTETAESTVEQIETEEPEVTPTEKVTEEPIPTETEEPEVTPTVTEEMLLVWESEDTSVATVDNEGMIFAVGVGETNVNAYFGEFSATMRVVVLPKMEPTVEDVRDVFSDVYNDWYVDYVQYVYDNSLMTGIKGTTKFAPDANITKAQVAQVLYNMEKQPSGNSGKVFSDLKDVYAVEWYADAVAWSYDEGIVTGDTNTKKFNPNANVTREELSLMFYRYAKMKGYDVSTTSSFEGLENAENVSNWAVVGAKWAVGEGLISGMDKNGVKDLAPQGNATRAQVAAILKRYFEKFEIQE